MSAEEAQSFLEPTYRMYVENRDRKYVPGSEHLMAAARWIVSGRHSLLLSGRTGCGKTTLARSLCYMLSKFGVYHGCRIICASDIVRHCDGDDFFSVRNAPALMIDDLGVESVMAKSFGTTFMPVVDVMYYRYDKQLPTIITSNMTRETIGRTYGERVADRMKECYDVITFGNGSYR